MLRSKATTTQASMDSRSMMNMAGTLKRSGIVAVMRRKGEGGGGDGGDGEVEVEEVEGLFEARVHLQDTREALLQPFGVASGPVLDQAGSVR